MSLAERRLTPERMDIDCSDFEDYRRCLRDLSRVNRLTFTARPALRWLAHQGLRRGDRIALLDVGSGYGDILRAIEVWCQRRGIKAQLTGIDLNPWAIEAARAAAREGERIAFVQADAFAYVPEQSPDFIISSQFAHHLTGEQIVAFIRWMERSARRGWLISDLERNSFAYWGFGLLATAMLWHRFVRSDGMISITRGFRPHELAALCAEAGVADARISHHLASRITVERSK